ncbi:MAG: family 78 glycoside hydrolase catalytic domain [Clostridiaceae bacterium]|nr:family 78 glycoside hydrolase catalytic domain [Clostridiaceae bacterium]
MTDCLKNCESTVINECVPVDLMCEYATDPLGIDIAKPRFSWKTVCNRRGMKQTSYQILVAKSLEMLEQDIGEMWDSGKVESGISIGVVYGGKPLENRKCYWWKVRIWDEEGNVSCYSKAAKFETAFLDASEWKAQWIACLITKPGSCMFRREFRIDREITQARAYITGLGYYELRINGNKVGDHVLDPGWTDYTKRVLYSTYDVTNNLKIGMNAIGVILGNGWHCFSETEERSKCIPQMLLQLHINYADGEEEIIVSDRRSGWYASSDSPIVQNSIYNGETYDARLEKTGWDMAGFDMNGKDQGSWDLPLIVEGPGGELRAQALEPIKVISDIKPIRVTNPAPGIYVYDMGQNFAGWAKIRVKGDRGTVVTMKFAEVLYEDGTVNRENLRTARQLDTYILKGEGVEVYEPRFTYHGFRYVQLEGFPGEPDINTITGRVVRSSVEPIGSFSCSNTLVNQIHRNVVWTESNNLHSVPTDCPQRDERLGWLNDMTVRAEEAVFNFNLARLYSKWMDDITDAQGEKTGAITDVAPFIRYGGRPADPVASSYLIFPWLMYLHYGDIKVIEKHYENMKKWVSYMSGLAGEDYIINYSRIGDWAPPFAQAIEGSVGASAISAITPGALISTGYYYYNAVLMAKFAKVLGRAEEAVEYEELADKIKEAMNNTFFDRDTNNYGPGNQASNVFPLYLGIVPEENKQAVLDNLINDIVKNDTHITTGNLCTKYIIEVLTEMGRVDVAYALVTQTTYPSWGYMISKGATTIWERWEYVTGGKLIEMASHNHPMYGSVGAWFYKYLAGINVNEEGPGFSKFTIKPYMPDGLDFAEGSVKTMLGVVLSRWKRNDKALNMEVAVPCNSTAKICVPVPGDAKGKFIIKEGGRSLWQEGKFTGNAAGVAKAIEEDGYICFETGSGEYHFECIW